VNLARRLTFAMKGRPLDLFTAMWRRSPAPYGVLLDLGHAHVVGASPELSIEVRGARLRTSPIKGTRPRGRDAADDARLKAELEADPKERAELAMTVGLHRNDLGKIAQTGSVRVLGEPTVTAAATVHSREAQVVALRDVQAKLSAIASACLPAGSVTGAPKVRAMEIIADLEAHRRGLYTGAMGYVGRDGGLVLAMAIRTATVAGGVAHYFAGGGIVWGSDPAREVEETRWKAVQIATSIR
jgi:anthranilate/para-aminobenzoate synthase component I